MKIFCCFFLLIFSNTLLSQDTLIKSPNTKDTSHSVRKAALYSAILPGAGQIYNHLAQPKGKKNAWWKVPLIYSALGFTGYSIIKNQEFVGSLKSEYRAREKGVFEDERWVSYDNTGLITLYTQYSKKRDFAILGSLLIYGFQLADAAVEAHFVNFDISEDLSLGINPIMITKQAPGLSFTLNFR